MCLLNILEVIAMSNEIEKNNLQGGLSKDFGKIEKVLCEPAKKAGNVLGDALSKVIDVIIDSLFGANKR